MSPSKTVALSKVDGKTTTVKTPPQAKYVFMRVDDSWKTMSLMADYGLLKRSEQMYFLESPYLRDLYSIVHTNIVFAWLRLDFGPLDEAKIDRSAVQSIWDGCSADVGFLARGGAVFNFYCAKELKFWDEVLFNKSKIVIEEADL